MKSLYLLQKKPQTACAAHPASYSMVTGVLSRGYSGQGVKLTTHIHVALRLRMSEVGPLLLLHPFMV